MTILYYKGENIDQGPGQIIKVTVRNDLLEDFIEVYRFAKTLPSKDRVRKDIEKSLLTYLQYYHKFIKLNVILI